MKSEREENFYTKEMDFNSTFFHKKEKEKKERGKISSSDTHKMMRMENTLKSQ